MLITPKVLTFTSPLDYALLITAVDVDGDSGKVDLRRGIYCHHLRRRSSAAVKRPQSILAVRFGNPPRMNVNVQIFTFILGGGCNAQISCLRNAGKVVGLYQLFKLCSKWQVHQGFKPASQSTHCHRKNHLRSSDLGLHSHHIVDCGLHRVE